MAIKFVQAKNYTKGRLRKIRLIVIHSMEAAEAGTTAESVARYFSTTTRDASVHYNVDNDSVVQSVKEADTAYGAKNANADGIHVEHAGFAKQNRKDWLDTYSQAVLKRSAKLTAAVAKRYGIPVRRLTPAQIRSGMAGFAGHIDITEAYPPGSGHWDPGPDFPWDYYLLLVQTELDALNGKTRTRSRVVAALAAMGIAAAGATGVTVTNDAPAPKPTVTVTAKPTTAKPTTAPSTSKPASPAAVRTTTKTVTKTLPRTTTTKTVRVTLPRATTTVRREFVVVRPGDTLYALALDLGTTVARLRQLNPGVVPAHLVPGSRLRVP